MALFHDQLPGGRGKSVKAELEAEAPRGAYADPFAAKAAAAGKVKAGARQAKTKRA